MNQEFPVIASVVNDVIMKNHFKNCPWRFLLAVARLQRNPFLSKHVDCNVNFKEMKQKKMFTQTFSIEKVLALSLPVKISRCPFELCLLSPLM